MSDFRNTLSVLSLITFTLLFEGCASRPINIPLTKEGASKVKAVQVHLTSVSEQTYSLSSSVDTTAAHMNAQSSGNPVADLIGHIIAEGIIQGSNSNSGQKKDPLLDFTKTVNFSEPFITQFRKAFESSNWLHVNGVSQSTTPLSPEAKLEIRKSLGDISALFADSRYYFSGDYRRVYIEANVELWLSVESLQPLYRGNYLFCSEPVGIDQESIENYLQAWSEEGNNRLRKTLDKGIEEMRQMLNIGPLVRIEEAALDHQAAKQMQLNGCFHTPIKGEVISENNVRRIILSDGTYYSIPNL